MTVTQLDSPEVVITAGGTQERIDDVRYIGNFSGGRLGHELARNYAVMGFRVLLLAPDHNIERFGSLSGVEHRSFTSTASLQDQLLGIRGAKLILHAAAVSDYTPEPVQGKISSDQREMTIKLRRTPKILGQLRNHFGEETKIVGFKLLSGASKEKLVDTAMGQMTRSGTDLCIANDLQDIDEYSRILHMVHPEGQSYMFQGRTEVVAYQLAALIRPKRKNYVGTLV